MTLPNPLYSRLTRLEPGRVLLHSALAGLLVGLGGVVLTYALKLVSSALENLGAVSPELPSRGGVLFAFEGPLKLAPLIILPLLFLALALFRQMDPRKTALEGFIAGHHAAQKQAPLERTRGSLGRLLTGILTLGAGVPLGRDGPFAGLGSWLGGVSARLGRLEWDEARIVRLSGVAAGLGLALHAPLAAAVFAVEVLYRRFEFELEALLPAVLASVFAYGVYGSFEGFGPLFALELPVSIPALALPLCLLLGVFSAALGSTLAEVLEGVRRGWTALERPRGRLQSLPSLKVQVWLTPLVGLLLAILIVTVPQVQGEGLGWLQLGANGLLNPAELWGLGLFRLLALLLLASVGVPGGVLIPTLVLGGTLGAVLGGLQTLWLPDLGMGMGAWTVLGACSLLAGTSKTPLSSVLLGLAWGGESLLPGLIIGCVSAYALSSERTLFPAQVETRGQSSAHLERVFAPHSESDAPLSSTPLNTLESDTLKFEALESTESPDSGEVLYRMPVPVHLLGQAPQDALFAPHATLVALSRATGVWLPHPNLRLEQNDVLVLVATPEGYTALLERLSPAPPESVPVNTVQDEPTRAVPVADG